MNEHSLRVLEFHKIVAQLKEQAVSELGRQAAANIFPSGELETVRKRQKETSEARSILEIEGKPAFDGVRDLQPIVEKARVESVLQPSELLDVCRTLAAARRLRSFLFKLTDRYPLVSSIGVGMGVFQHIEDEINRCLAGSGEVLDAASPALASARSSLKSTHARLMDRLHSILQSSQYRTAIQDPVVTLREDRYCIPVKSEYRSQLPGIVHDSSASGATLFIEPTLVVEMGNDLKRLAIKEREEVEKVLSRLTALVTASADDIEGTLDALAQADFVFARARLSIQQSASEPEMNDSGLIDARDARHPLLTGEVVPIDIELGSRFRALLITGPNTGGKTVTLKTTGILTLMAQSGLHVPALPGARMAVFDEVFADIGDEQSIEQSLSTFSSHIGNIVRVIRDLSPNSLVLLDEIGAGTDPAEGAALAKALLEHFIGMGARVVATTHYGELKEFAFVNGEVENACVDFDPETLKPTYRLIIGVPGSSNAFAIASRLGMPDSIVSAAEANVFGEGDTSAEVIKHIEQARRAALDERREAQKALAEAQDLRRQYEAGLRKIEDVRLKARKAVQDEAENVIRKYKKRLERTLDQLSKQKAETRRAEKLEKDAGQALEEMTERLVEIPEIIEEEEPAGDYTFRVGQPVRIASLRQEGTLVNEISGDEATVQIGSIRVTVPASELRPGRKEERKPEVSQEVSSSMVQAQYVSPELKLIAQRVEPALQNLESYLDDAFASGIAEARIIHGMGSGALKRAVWEFLKDHPAIESYRLGDRHEGGAGATIVVFKK